MAMICVSGRLKNNDLFQKDDKEIVKGSIYMNGLLACFIKKKTMKIPCA